MKFYLALGRNPSGPFVFFEWVIVLFTSRLVRQTASTAQIISPRIILDKDIIFLDRQINRFEFSKVSTIFFSRLSIVQSHKHVQFFVFSKTI